MERQAKDGVYRQVGPDEWVPVIRMSKDGVKYRKIGPDDWAPADNTKGFGYVSPEQKAKNAKLDAPGFLPDDIEKEFEQGDLLGPGIRALDATGGFIRTGLMNVAGLLSGKGNIVSEDDVRRVAEGSAPQTEEYLGRLGMPEGKARTGLGFAGDVVTGSPRAIGDVFSGGKAMLSKASGRFGRPTTEEIEKAAAALNVKPTKGMLTDDYVVRNLEDSLSQSPSIPGALVRRERDPILNAADDVTRESLEGAAIESELQAGKNIKAGLKENFEGKLAPLEKSYDEISTHTKNIPVDEKGLKRIATNIRKIEGAEFKGSDAERVASQFAGWLEEAKSVDAIKRLRTKALERARDITKSGEERNAAGIIAQKLSQAQSNTITRQAVAIAKESPVDKTAKGKFLNKAQKKVASEEAEAEGLDLGRRLVGDIKQTNKSYRGLMEEAKDFGKGSGLTKAKGSARGVIDDIDSANPQDMASALFDSGNLEFTQMVKARYPREFEIAKAQRLSDISKKVNGSPKVLSNIIAKMSPEEKMLLFGDEMSGRLDNVSTLLRALPPKVGASDTPRGLGFNNILSPTQNLNDFGRYGLLKSSGLLGERAKKAIKAGAKGAGKQGLIHAERD